jgi:hypothetical protein
MKSSAFIAISLALIMLLLVLSATIFFLFQERQDLDEELQSSSENNRTLGQQQAQLELDKSAAQSTVESLKVLQATTSFENMDLNEQLVNTDQLQATLEVQGAQLASDLDSANATINAYRSQAPIVNVVEPQAGASITVGQPVNLVIVASDSVGIKAVDFSIAAELFGGPVEEVQQSVTFRELWVPQSEGSFTLAVTAVNNNGILSESFSTDFTVIPAATSTPEPSATPEPTAVPASP